MNKQTLLDQDHLDSWQLELIQSYKNGDDLFKNGLIEASEVGRLQKVGEQFKIRITPYYAKLMKNSPDCPIRKQAIPHLAEQDPLLPEWAMKLSQEVYGKQTPWQTDAIGDLKNLAAPRLTHRYENRVIIHVSSSCSVYCRFCFRKTHLNDKERLLYQGTFDSTYQYLLSHPEINEVILTGGDPLSVSDTALMQVLENLAQISTIEVVRIHSRMAVTLPSRFTKKLLEVLGREWPFQIYLVSHFNHPVEITKEAQQALYKLRRKGVGLFNQSVLLAGINDSVKILERLFHQLYAAGVVPFYLHHPDWTEGTFHFRRSIEKGQMLFSELRGLVSGPALPDYVLDIPQGYGKISLLGTSIKKVREVSAQDGIGGALYEVLSPKTRVAPQSTHLYLDLFPMS